MRQNDFTSDAAKHALAQLGSRIRRARRARKWSLSQLEDRLRIHRSTLGRLERGDPGVSLSVLFSVLEALGELADIELLLSRPETPKHLRTVPVPIIDQDF